MSKREYKIETRDLVPKAPPSHYLFISVIPNFSCLIWRMFGPTGFFRVSVDIDFFKACETVIQPSQVILRLKWWQMLMCFNLLSTEASLQRITAPWFLFNRGQLIGTFIGECWNMCSIDLHCPKPCFAQSLIARYSASVINRVTNSWQWFFNETRELCTKNTNSVVDWCVSISPA